MLLKQAMPGPGTYQPKDGISAKGDYFVSTMQSSKASLFSKGARNQSVVRTKSGTLIPGPGTYEVPSEFGYGNTRSRMTELRANKTTFCGFWVTPTNDKRKINTSYVKSRGLLGNKSVPDLLAPYT